MRKALITIVTLLLASQVCLAEAPRLFMKQEFSAAGRKGDGKKRGEEKGTSLF